MRPTVYGREILFNSQGELLGINLGFNFYVEHEMGTQGLVAGINEFAYPTGITPQQYQKQHKKIAKALSKWEKSPYTGLSIAPSAQVFTRSITINNDDLDFNLRQRQLKNGEYVLFSMTGGISSAPVYWNRRIGTRTEFREDELLYMPDYQSHYAEVTVEDFAASWASDGLMILFRKEAQFSVASVVDELSSAIGANRVVCVPQLQGFKLHGCILAIVDKMYYTPASDTSYFK